MARIRHSTEQIINKLREAEVLLGQGQKAPEVTRQLDVTVPVAEGVRRHEND